MSTSTSIRVYDAGIGEALIYSDFVAEVRGGVELLDDPHRREELLDWLTHKLRLMFEQRVITIN